MRTITTALESLETLIANRWGIVKLRVRFSDDAITIKFYLPQGRELNFEFEVSGSLFRLVVRDMIGDVVISTVELFDFDSTNGRVKIAREKTE